MKKSYLKGRIVVREATEEDALRIAHKLRDVDRMEMWSAYRVIPEKGALGSLRGSDRAFTVTLEGKPIAIFGVMTLSLVGRRGTIWLLGTDDIDQICITFGRYTKAFVQSFLSEWDTLENWVHEKNRRSIGWLKMAGFEVSDAKPYGLDRENFHHIRIGKERKKDVYSRNINRNGNPIESDGRGRTETAI